MNSRSRSVLGAALAIFLIPAVFGVLACLPVPIGDPERSEIDPYFSGLWVHEFSGGLMVANFEPYDRRTWLLATPDSEPMVSVWPFKSSAAPDAMTTGEASGMLLVVEPSHFAAR